MEMRVFRNLFIRGEPASLTATVTEVERNLSRCWFRDGETERRLGAVSNGAGGSYCFGCFDDGNRPGATVVLTANGPDTLYVSNVIPHSRHRLDYDQYNRVVTEFCDRFVRPAAAKTGVAVDLTDTQADLEQWMSHETAELLRQFSACANKGTGASHPNDRERWNAFIVSTHRDGSRMAAADLRRWLSEVEGWAPEVAERLAAEYEYGREILAFADKQRRSA
jgi:hypothetical protein